MIPVHSTPCSMQLWQLDTSVRILIIVSDSNCNTTTCSTPERTHICLTALDRYSPPLSVLIMPGRPKILKTWLNHPYDLDPHRIARRHVVTNGRLVTSFWYTCSSHNLISSRLAAELIAEGANSSRDVYIPMTKIKSFRGCDSESSKVSFSSERKLQGLEIFKNIVVFCIHVVQSIEAETHLGSRNETEMQVSL